MHTLDIIVLVVAFIFFIIGLKRGLVGEIIRLVAMVAGFVVAFLYYIDFSTYLSFLKIPLSLKNAVSFIILYIISALVILGIGWIIKKIVHLTPFGFFDHLFGGLIGIAKALLIAWVVCLSVSSFAAPKIQKDFGKSFTYRKYKQMPQTFSLKGIIKTQKTIRNFLNDNTPDKASQIDKKSRHIHQVADSAQNSLNI